MKTVEAKDRGAWRAWLAANHDREQEVWLVYYKKGTGIACVSYSDSLDEALCFGWVDSLIKSLDERRYARKFTPRREDSKWSLVNKQRVEALIEADLMTEHGLKKVEAARRSGRWDDPVRKPELDIEMPPEFAQALRKDPQAQAAFDQLAPTYRKQYLGWINTAKRTATKEKRIAESIRLLAAGKKLGLK